MIDNRVFDGRAPTVVINGTGETFGLFGPGNDPISGNAINDTDPYYFTTDEDVTIYFDWQHDPNYLEDMYGFTSTDVKINGNSDHGLSLTGPGDDNVYSMILSGMGSGAYINPDGNTIISLEADVASDVAGNNNTAGSFTFRFDITAPTLVISATRVGGAALTQSGLYNFSDNVKFTFTWTEQNRWGNVLEAGDLDVNGFVIGNATFAQGNDNTTYTLTIPNANLEQTGTMVSVIVPTRSVQDIGGMYGPAENTAFSFYFDRTAPTARVNTEESGTWNPLLDNIIVKGDNVGYGGDSAYVANGSHHGGILDNNAETYTVTFDWNGIQSGDELVPIDFGGGNVIILRNISSRFGCK